MLKIKKMYHSIQEKCPHFARRFFHNLLVGVLFMVVLMPLEDTETFQWFEDVGIDWVIQMFRATPPKDNKTPSFVVLDIDEATYQAWGEPLMTPRDKLLQLIKMATDTEKQAKIVMIDVELSYRTDRSQPLDHPNNQADKALYDFFENYAETCKGNENCPYPYIFLTRLSRPSLETNRPYREQVTSFLDPVVTPEHRIYWAATLFDLESDQVMRRWHLWQATCRGDMATVLPSMQLLAKAVHDNSLPRKLAELAQYKPDCRIRGNFEINHSEEARLNSRILYRIPWSLQDNEKLPMVNGHTILDSVSVKTLTEDTAKTVDASFFKDRIVIIGGSYEASRDIYATPLGKMPGSWVLANATHSLLQHGELEPAKKLKYLAEGFLILLMSVVFACFSLPWGVIATLIAFTIVIIPASFWLFEDGVWLSFVGPLFGIAAHSVHATHKELREKSEGLQRQIEEMSHVR